MASTEHMDWHKAHGNHGNHVFHVFDSVTPIPLQPLPRVRPPQLRCHQPPVTHTGTDEVAHINRHAHANKKTRHRFIDDLQICKYIVRTVVSLLKLLLFITITTAVTLGLLTSMRT